MPYDPEVNPRSLGGEVVEPEPDLDHRSALEAQAAALTQALDCFAHPGWAHVVATLEAITTSRTEQLLSSDESLARIGSLRGQISAFRRVLALPEDWRTQLNRLHAELAAEEGSTPELEP